MIRVEGISKIFGSDPASVIPLLEQGQAKSEIQQNTGHVVGINQASFDVKAGEVFCIMGLSGSGKSTLIRCVNRLIEPTSGRIVYTDPDAGEQDVTAMDAVTLRGLRMQHMSMVFQHFALFPHRTVLANATYGLEVQGVPAAERDKAGREVLERVGLGQWARAYPTELSGGMQQRVGLARALATRARVMLMDEAFSALDPLIKVQMQQMLVDIQRDMQRTILFITHDLDEAMRIGDRIAIMDAGRIVQIGTPEEILVNPLTDYVADFVEHADATSVITAGTVAMPFNNAWFNVVESANGVRWHARSAQARIQYGVDDQGVLHAVRAGGEEVRVEALAAALDGSPTDAERSADLVLCCGPEAVLRDVLRGRAHSALPILMTDDQNRIQGVIDEPELVRGILEKRGHEPANGGQGQ